MLVDQGFVPGDADGVVLLGRSAGCWSARWAWVWAGPVLPVWLSGWCFPWCRAWSGAPPRVPCLYV